MFCTKCGANIPDDSSFCPQCGESFAAAPAAVAVAPVATAPVTQPGLSAKKRGLSKKEFLKTEASAGVKLANKLTLAVFAMVLVLVLLATITVNTISIVDLPIVQMTVPEEEREELMDIVDEADNTMKEFEEALDRIKERYDDESFRRAEDVVDKWEKLSDKFSLSNAIALVDATHDLSTELADELDMKSDIENLEDISQTLRIVRIITYAFGVVIALLALWAATRKKTSLSVACILLSVPVYGLLSSLVLAGLLFVAFVAMAVCTSRVNKAWKKAAI